MTGSRTQPAPLPGHVVHVELTVFHDVGDVVEVQFCGQPVQYDIRRPVVRSSFASSSHPSRAAWRALQLGLRTLPIDALWTMTPNRRSRRTMTCTQRTPPSGSEPRPPAQTGNWRRVAPANLEPPFRQLASG